MSRHQNLFESAGPHRESRPKRSNRGCFIALGLGAALTLCVLSGLVFWGYSWIRDNTGELKALGEEARSSGEAFGRGRAAEDCEARAWEAMKACGAPMNIPCIVRARLSFDACLDVATTSEAYCEEVPPPEDVLDSLAFIIERCDEHDLYPDDQRCQDLGDAIRDHCHPDPRR